jgi:hypothetical protein
MAETEARLHNHKVGAEEQTIEMFVEYQVLPVADFSAILSHLSQAYELLSVSKYSASRSNTLGSPNRVQFVVKRQGRTPLRIERIETGHSIVLICAGAGAAVLHLALVAKKVFDVRKTIFESEKIKWEAKEAKRVFENRTEGPIADAVEAEASTQVSKLMHTVDRAKTITKFRLQLGNFLTIEHTKDFEPSKE